MWRSIARGSDGRDESRRALEPRREAYCRRGMKEAHVWMEN